MRILYLILILALSYSQILGQSERPETIVIPVSSLGEVTETRKQILQNSLEENLKDFFMVVSQERFEKAQEAAFEELDYEECTEDQCIVLIQEMLQVENVFSLQVIVEGNDTQLSLSWRNLDEKKKATDVCRNCDSFELNDRISILVKKLIDVSSIKQVSSLSIEEMRKKVEKEEKEIKDIQEKEIYFDEFYRNRNVSLIFGYTSSNIEFEQIPDNSSWNVNDITFTGYNIGLRYYLYQNISLDGSISQKTLSETVFQNISHIPSNQSGTYTDINLGGTYHWYFTSWDVFTGGGYTSYSFSSIFQDNTGIVYQLESSNSGLHWNIGFDYNFMNNYFMNLEILLIFSGVDELFYTNNPNKHIMTTSPSFFRWSVGYNF